MAGTRKIFLLYYPGSLLIDLKAAWPEGTWSTTMALLRMLCGRPSILFRELFLRLYSGGSRYSEHCGDFAARYSATQLCFQSLLS